MTFNEQKRESLEKAVKGLMQIQLKVMAGVGLTLDEQKALWECFTTAMTNEMELRRQIAEREG
jgi:hypothetical protein